MAVTEPYGETRLGKAKIIKKKEGKLEYRKREEMKN